jgi:hypothetical protein
MAPGQLAILACAQKGRISRPEQKTLRISAKREVEGREIAAEIGPISAVSAWHGQWTSGDTYKESALEKLKRLAKEFEADAIIGLNYTIDDVVENDLAPVPLRRVNVSGVAVKLARAS